MRHSIEEIRAEYDRLDSITGLETTGVVIRISNKAAKQRGLCSLKKENNRYIPYKITISHFVMEEDEGFLNTIRHEYAHAAVALITGEKHGHDRHWKTMCHRVGARPERTAIASEAQTTILESKRKYILRCDKCGWSATRLKKTKAISSIQKRENRYRCPKCHSSSLIAERA